MKKIISTLLSLCLIMAIAPPQLVADAWPARVLPGKTGAYEKYSPLDGLEWLRNQEAMDKIIEEETLCPDEDFSIYDMAKQSIIFKINDPIAFAEGYKLYIDSKNTDVKPFVKNERAFVPLRFIAESLKLKIKWEEETKSAVLSNSANKITVTVGKNEIDVNGEKKQIDASPVNENGRIFVPLRAIAESLGKEVIYENGIVIVTSKSGKELLTEAHMAEIEKADFELDRDRVIHPQPQGVIRWMMSSGNRSRLNWDDEQIAELIDPYMNMSYHALATFVEETVKTKDDGTPRHIGERPDFEKAGQMMSVLYERTGNEEYAMRIIIMLYHSAIHFDELETYDYNSFYNYSYVTPETLLFAYDKIYHSPMWDLAAKAYGFDLKEVIREWMGVIYDYLIINKIGRPVGNYPTWIGGVAGMAMILDDPDRMRDMILIFEEAFKPYNFYADGMWYEGSFDYATQMVGNVGSGMNIVNSYRDPFGYVDEENGYEFRNGLTGSDEWTDFSNHVNSLSKLSYYPDGSRLTVNDTHWDDYEKNLQDNTIKEQYVKDNIEMNHFGLYGLRYGDSEEAQQVNLTVQTSSSISHQHGSPLAMSYFAGGMEVFPDQGYVTPTTLHRYSTTTSYGHNMAYIGAPSTSGNDAYWIGPNIIAYDNGSRTGKQVQLIEGSQLMTEEREAEINRRALMMIATDKNHSYVVDIQRLKGNTNHEAYLHQSEDEDVELVTDLPLGEKHTGLMSEWLSTKGIFSGMIAKHSYAKVIKNAQGLKTDEPFKFSWKGKTSGTTVNAFIKGSKNTVVGFADYPTLRRTKRDVALKDSFPGYIMYRGRAVTPEDTTIFGSVYEGFREGEKAKVENVEWYEPDDGNPMTAMLKVEGTDFTDFVYLSNDMESRSFEGITFSGSYALLRKDKDGKVVYGYIFGEGSISEGSYSLSGKKDISAKVVSASGARAIYEDVENILKINSAPPKDIEGLWCNVTFSDNSGTAYRIEEVRESVIKIHNDPGFTVDKDGAKFTAYPMYEYHGEGKLANFASPFNDDMEQRYREGDVIFTVKYPTFAEN